VRGDGRDGRGRREHQLRRVVEVVLEERHPDGGLAARRAPGEVDGLTPATVVEFRFRSLRREGYSDWSSPVSIIVH
jgi:hypothetical protein